VRKLVLGNAAYRKLDGICEGHITSEGAELQDGLVNAGWAIAGKNFSHYVPRYFNGTVEYLDETRVDIILEKLQPDVVFVQDPRDMQSESPGCFDKWTHFENIEALASYGGKKVLVFKDAGSGTEYQRLFAQKIHADALVCYYHDKSILKLSPWANDYRRIRIYHSVDGDVIARLNLSRYRSRGIVTGAAGNAMVYPLRYAVFRKTRQLDINQLPHPGYGNSGCKTPSYLTLLTDFKVHVATASVFGFALRKIFESICCGCIPITDLPDYDKLPIIDPWIVRVPNHIDMESLKILIDCCETSWEQRTAWLRATAAAGFYDYRAAGKRLDAAIRDLWS
jgi:hypothetical protein